MSDKKALQPERQRRKPICAAGRLVYETHIDQDKLQCLYCCVMCTICKREEAARRSFLDVYTNGIMVNAPVVSLCCFMSDHTRFMFWDDPRIRDFGKASCCKPAPHCCPHCCHCCGEVFYFFRCFGACRPESMPTGLGHTAVYLPFFFYSACCITDLFCGLAPGEAEKLNHIVQGARFGFFTLIEYPPIHPACMGEPISNFGSGEYSPGKA